MRMRWIAWLMTIPTTLATAPALACMAEAPLDLDDVRYADAVVVGRIANYEMVLDQQWRREHPDLVIDPATDRFMTDYARFDVIVDEVLLGDVARTITVTWDNSTFGEPESMLPGPYLIAFRNPRSAGPPLRGPSATIVPNREPASLTILQAPCSVPFMFEQESDEAAGIRRILSRRSQR